MENSKTEAEISFRFLNLNKLQAFTLKREILGSMFTQQCQNNNYVGYAPLSKQNLDDINDYYVRQRVEIEDCDILVSVVSESETDIINVPIIVNRMLKYIDCKLTFSFTAR